MGPDPEEGHPVAGTHIWGWMSYAELTWLHRTAIGMGSVAEVGSLHGRSGWALASGCPGPVYLIDPWNDPGEHSWQGIVPRFAKFPNVHLVRGYSPAVAADIPDVDLVFIDGAHDEASVRADLEAWIPKCKRLICGHDYIHGGGFPDVATVVDDVFGGKVRVAPPNEWGDTSIWTVDLTPPRKKASHADKGGTSPRAARTAGRPDGRR